MVSVKYLCETFPDYATWWFPVVWVAAGHNYSTLPLTKGGFLALCRHYANHKMTIIITKIYLHKYHNNPTQEESLVSYPLLGSYTEQCQIIICGLKWTEAVCGIIFIPQTQITEYHWQRFVATSRSIYRHSRPAAMVGTAGDGLAIW